MVISWKLEPSVGEKMHFRRANCPRITKSVVFALRFTLASCSMVASLAQPLVASAQAAPAGNVVTIRLTNGGSIRGTILVDMPGQPLVVESGGRTYEIERTQIVDVVRDAAPAQPPPTWSGSPGSAPLVAPPAAAPAVVPQGGQQLTLVPDRWGYALIDPSWDPRIVSLVHQRNAAQRRTKTSFVLPAVLAGVGLVGIIGMTVGYNRMLEGCVDDDYYDDYAECADSANNIRIGVTAFLGVVHAVGLALIVRAIVRRIGGKSARRRIDQELLQYNVVPSLELSATGRPSHAGLGFVGRF